MSTAWFDIFSSEAIVAPRDLKDSSIRRTQ
jgi:hypothetical protein